MLGVLGWEVGAPLSMGASDSERCYAVSGLCTTLSDLYFNTTAYARNKKAPMA